MGFKWFKVLFVVVLLQGGNGFSYVVKAQGKVGSHHAKPKNEVQVTGRVLGATIVGYDEARDKTVVRMHRSVDLEPGGEVGQIKLYANFSYPGQEFIRPDTVNVIVSLPCRFAEKFKLKPIICFGGDCFENDPCSGIGSGGRNSCWTGSFFDVLSQTFLSGVAARAISIQLGERTVDLEEKHFDLLRTFAHRMEP